MESTLSLREWAESLVGRDWEIYWNSEEEPDQPKDRNERAENEKDDDSEGSIIEDWYAGRVLEARVQESGAVIVKVLFVGDEQIYEMELSPSKVRPSARGWIKRTIALLSRRGDLPPDTATPDDRRHIQSLQVPTRHYEPIPSITPSLSDLHLILEFQHQIRAQIYLRSKLATIVNLHGSIKYIDGEPNPTEPLVNHLRDCCSDLEHACDWYLKCWDLLTTCFGQRSGQSSNERDCQPLDYENLLETYLDFGKNCILNCATMDLESTTSKRRHQLTTSPTRRPKRRRKNNNQCATDGDLDFDGDFRCSTFVDYFVHKLDHHESWYMSLFTKMLQTLSHAIVNPLVQWKYKANLLLNLLEETVEEDDGSKDDEAMSVESHDDHVKFFVYEDVEACLAMLEADPVLSLVDFSDLENALQKKLQVIDETAVKAKALLERLANDPPGASGDDTSNRATDDDDVLEGLREMDLDLHSPEHPCYNVNPIGRAGASVTRAQLKGAGEWRRWLLDVHHAVSTRERKSFVEKLARRIGDLPDLSGINLDLLRNLSDRRTQAEQKLREIISAIDGISSIEQKYTQDLERGDQRDSYLFEKDGVQEALMQLAKLPVLLLVEEKIAIRLAFMDWCEKANESLPKGDAIIGFTQLEKLFQSLMLIYKGETKCRTRLTGQLRTSEKIEYQVRIFAVQEATRHNSYLLERVKALYSLSSQWKEKAEAIILALRLHGNASLGGDAKPCLKLPAMVDIKRISDLVFEYNNLGVEIPGYTTSLQKILDDATEWSFRLENNLIMDDLPMEQRLDMLQRERQMRPKGLIMDPTRQVIETLLDLLEWHASSKTTLFRLVATLQQQPFDESQFTEMLGSNVYPLLAEGLEIVELFSTNHSTKFQTRAEVSSRTLTDLFHIRRTARALLRERVEAHTLGKRLLHLMVKEDVDIQEGSPLLLYIWIDWHLSVIAFVHGVDEQEIGADPQTISKAESLLASQPGLDSTSSISPLSSLVSHKSTAVMRLSQLIQEARDVESDIRDLLAKSRELRRGILGKADAVRQHLIDLKERQTIFKDRSSGNHGLLLDSSLETHLDHHIRIFAWIVRTLSYPFLYLDEASYSGPVDVESDQHSRIPYDVLVSFFERLPQEGDVYIDDFALVSMRVRELYEAAKKWQDEITRTTMLSNRGGKRRTIGQPLGKAEQETDATSELHMEKMKKLASNPILSKVVMAREGAVNGILRSSQEFEEKLHAFLSKDFDGLYADRAPYPNSHSLVGRKGEFILFRLTMSELFDSVLQSVHELSLIAENVHAETAEKTTFLWIQRAVMWIVELNDAVTDESPFQTTNKKALIIPEEIGRLLLESGREIFLDLPDNLKKTLSVHGIYVSTNKQDQSLRVTLKKDGAHHSVGGTVIRWCPILFDCLRSDLRRLDTFRKELLVTFQEFNTFYLKMKAAKKESTDCLYDWFCYHQRASHLLEEGARSLVVAPKETFVEAFYDLRESIQRVLSTQSNPDLDKKFSKMWYEERTSVLDERFILLESLLYRRFVAQEIEPTYSLIDDAKDTFRDICRNYLFSSLTEALKTIGIAKLDEEFGPSLLESLCSIKAWDIEGEMFAKFQNDVGLTRVSEEYRSKARNLRASLSDKNNTALCLRILLGDVSPVELVKMSKDELASQQRKLERARAEIEFRNNTNLTPQISAVVPPPNEKKEEKEGEAETKSSPNGKSVLLGRPASILRQSKLPPRQASTTTNSIEMGTNQPMTVSETSKGDFENKPFLQSEEVSMPDRSTLLSLEAMLKIQAKPRGAPPPPPPSLVNSFQQSSHDESDEDYEENEPDVDVDIGRQIYNDSGGFDFQFESSYLRLSFRFALYLEDERFSGVDRFIPEKLLEKGRVPGNEFSKFVVQKAAGSWIAIPLRIEALSDNDDRELDRLCEVYQEKDRVPMISVNADTKLFLVIPHFHDALGNIGSISFSHASSSYAVVLTKDSRFDA